MLNLIISTKTFFFFFFCHIKSHLQVPGINDIFGGCYPAWHMRLEHKHSASCPWGKRRLKSVPHCLLEFPGRTEGLHLSCPCNTLLSNTLCWLPSLPVSLLHPSGLCPLGSLPEYTPWPWIFLSGVVSWGPHLRNSSITNHPQQRQWL